MTHRRSFQPIPADERAAARQEAADLYRDGHTIRCVAGQIGRPWSTTRELLDDAGVTFRPRGGKSRCTNGHPEATA